MSLTPHIKRGRKLSYALMFIAILCTGVIAAVIISGLINGTVEHPLSIVSNPGPLTVFTGGRPTLANFTLTNDSQDTIRAQTHFYLTGGNLTGLSWGLLACPGHIDNCIISYAPGFLVVTGEINATAPAATGAIQAHLDVVLAP